MDTPFSNQYAIAMNPDILKTRIIRSILNGEIPGEIKDNIRNKTKGKNIIKVK